MNHYSSGISFVIPVAADGARGPQILSRLHDVLSSLAPLSGEIIIGDASRQRNAEVTALAQNFAARIIHAPHRKLFSPGSTRDAAVAAATRPYIFLFDVDLCFAPDFPQHLKTQTTALAAAPNAFAMFPCLYLTRPATTRVEQDPTTLNEIWHDYLKGDFSHTTNLATASSALLLRKDTYISVGGHRPDFTGHGGEDLDLIDRLTRHYPQGQRPTDYPDDITQKSIAASRGFRRYFSYYSLPLALNGALLAHRWHPRPLFDPYFRQHSENAKRLQHFLAAPLASNHSLPPLPPLSDFITEKLKENGYDPATHRGLFMDQWQGQSTQQKLWRKARKLFLTPGQFWRDSKARPWRKHH